jgi:hypothetical protein
MSSLTGTSQFQKSINDLPSFLLDQGRKTLDSVGLSNIGYRVNDGIGSPAGNVVFEGFKWADSKYPKDGIYVRTKNRYYRVPDQYRSRDEIRAWVIRSVNSGDISGDLYQPGASTAKTGEPYRVNDPIGTPSGELIFEGYKSADATHASNGRYVRSRTTSYRVPDQYVTRDEVRSWVIGAVKSGAITTPLYLPKDGSKAPEVVTSPATSFTAAWTVAAANRPLTNLLTTGRSALNLLLNKFPGAGKLLSPLINAIPPGANKGDSDFIRLEINTTLPEKSNVFHAKLNVASLISLGKGGVGNVFAELAKNAATPAQKAEVAFYKKLVDGWMSKPGLRPAISPKPQT